MSQGSLLPPISPWDLKDLQDLSWGHRGHRSIQEFETSGVPGDIRDFQDPLAPQGHILPEQDHMDQSVEGRDWLRVTNAFARAIRQPATAGVSRT